MSQFLRVRQYPVYVYRCAQGAKGPPSAAAKMVSSLSSISVTLDGSVHNDGYIFVKQL
jgi:hypothetical protein